MGIRKVDYQYSVICQSGCLHLFYRKRCSFQCHFFPFIIQLLQMLCLLLCFFIIICHQKIQTQLSILQPSGRINAWAKYKSHMICLQLLLLQLIGPDQRPQSDISGTVHLFQSPFHQYTILVRQLHDITDGCHCHEFNKILCRFYLYSAGLIKHLYKLICHSGSAKLLIWVAAIRLFRVYDCICRRNYILFVVIILIIFERNIMMVRDHDRHSQTFGISGCIICRNTVITGQDHFDPCLLCLLHHIGVHTITICDPVRNPVIYLCIASKQCPV